MLHVAELYDACSQLSNKDVSGEGANSPFVLIGTGKCSFEIKVQIAQDVGSNDLVSMNGNSK